MAGTPPEQPEQFVCMNCHTIAAGVPTDGGPDEEKYVSPPECGACGRDDFARFSRFDRAYADRS